MKTYHNDINTSGITKIALKKIWTFFDKEERPAKLQKSDFQSHFSTSKIVQIFTKKKSLKNINLGQQLLLKSFFDKFNFENNLLLKIGWGTSMYYVSRFLGFLTPLPPPL